MSVSNQKLLKLISNYFFKIIDVQEQNNNLTVFGYAGIYSFLIQFTQNNVYLLQVNGVDLKDSWTDENNIRYSQLCFYPNWDMKLLSIEDNQELVVTKTLKEVLADMDIEF